MVYYVAHIWDSFIIIYEVEETEPTLHNETE